MTDESKNEIIENSVELTNSYRHFTSVAGGFNGVTTQLSQTDTLFQSNRWYLVSNYRQLLSELYVEHGIVQTLIDQPVDDAFRKGFEIKTGELDGDDIDDLMTTLEREGVIRCAIQAVKYARLFGGAGIVIMTDQKPDQPLDIEQITEDDNLDFRAVDMWELNTGELNVNPSDVGRPYSMGREHYNYYDIRLHGSRVYEIHGKEAPSFVRPRLRGWGMSEVERLIRSLNKYFKNQEVLYELLDEAKVDVYKIKGLNEALATIPTATKVADRVQLANQLKNYLSALTMDVDDDYQQKQVSFTGLADVMKVIREGIAADLKMPVTKLFGISSAGFNSGEDDIENYNSMIESEIRAKNKFLIIDLVAIVCQKKFGFVPSDLMIEWPTLRELDAETEQSVKNHKFNRVMSSYQSGLITAQEAKEIINKEDLLGVEVDQVSDGLEPLDGQFLVGDGDKVDE